MIEVINKTKNKNKTKKGITIVMLVITIIIMIIITSIVLIGVTNLITSGKKTAFATDLKNVQDAVEIYYNDNGVLPIKEGVNPYLLVGFKALAGDSAIELENEVTENQDTGSLFYEIDMDKIKSSGGTKGRKKNGVANDIFIVSSVNIKVYYPKGEKIGPDIYFSLTNKLTKGNNFSKENTDPSQITTVETQGIKIIKNKKDWTNDLTITVETTIDSTETASYSIAGVSQATPTINSGTTTLTLNSSSIQGETATAFNAATASNKTIVIEKKNTDTGEVLATAIMNISNLDLVIGTVQTPTIKSYDNSNVLDFSNSVDNGGSNIKEIRYEYITKLNLGSAVTSISIANPGVITLNNHGLVLNKSIIFTTTGALPTGITAGTVYYAIPVTTSTFKLSTAINGSALITTGTQSGIHTYSTLEDYYPIPPTINSTYMLNSSKKQEGTSISIPKYIRSLAVSIVDKAGNISNHGTIDIPAPNLKGENKSYGNNGIILDKPIVKPTTNIINPAAGTVEAWVEVNNALRVDVAEKTIFSTYADEKYKNTIVLRHNRDNMWQAIMSSDISQVSDISVADTLSDGMHLFTIKWSATEFTLYIDGVKTTATASAPRLMQSVPDKFYIGGGPRLNLVRNGYVNQGNNSNFTSAAMIYTTEDYYSAPSCIKSSTVAYPFSVSFEPVDFIAIDPNKTYYQSAWVKQLKAGSTSVNYYGINTYDQTRVNVINSTQVTNYANTRTELTVDLITGDTHAHVKSAANWKTSGTDVGSKNFAIYNYKDYPEYTYTRNTYPFTTSSTVDNTVTFTAAYTGPLVKTGTKVSNGYTGVGNYIYSSFGGIVIPNTWKKYSSYISGSVVNQANFNQFRYGTRYIKPIFLINWNSQAGENLLIDDIEFIDMTNTVFNTKIQEVCISKIDRSDGDILKRYTSGVLTKDSNVTYMLTEK